MDLKPQDIVLTLKLALNPDSPRPAYAVLADELAMSVSEVHAAASRAKQARLLHAIDSELRVDRTALLEFLVHGVKYAYPAQRGALTRGIPTSYAAPPLNAHFAKVDEPPPVWPHADGTVRGLELSPLAKNVPRAAMRDQRLYEMLALIDAIRDGRTRERRLAENELIARLANRKVDAKS